MYMYMCVHTDCVDLLSDLWITRDFFWSVRNMRRLVEKSICRKNNSYIYIDYTISIKVTIIQAARTLTISHRNLSR